MAKYGRFGANQLTALIDNISTNNNNTNVGIIKGNEIVFAHKNHLNNGQTLLNIKPSLKAFILILF